MAKLGLVFVCIFFIVQLTLAARVVRDATEVRDAPETPTKADGTSSNAFNLNEALATLQQGLHQAFSKQNLDKLMENMGDYSDKLKELGQNFLNKAQETAADLANSAAKKDEKSPST